MLYARVDILPAVCGGRSAARFILAISTLVGGAKSLSSMVERLL